MQKAKQAPPARRLRRAPSRRSKMAQVGAIQIVVPSGTRREIAAVILVMIDTKT